MNKQHCTPVAALLAAVTLFLITAASASAGPGYALSFDGVDDYVTVPDHDALTFTNAFTWEAWVKITKTNWPTWEGWATIIAKDTFTREYWFSINSYTDYKMDVRFDNATYNYPSSSSVPLQSWQHVAVTWDGTNVCYYLNGQLDGTSPRTQAMVNTTNVLKIGVDAGITGGCYHFQGLMDELRLWNVARSQAEIQAAMNRPLSGSETGLVAYWPFNNSAANSATLTGTACDGALGNSPSFVLSDVPFVPDAATAAVSAIGLTSATLNGTVNPGNLATAAWFQWGTTTNYGNTTAIINRSATNLSFSLSNVLTGLTPGQVYHARLVATNSAGVVAGGDVTWTNLILPPAVTTLAVTGIGFTSATLNGTINPNDLIATAWFEWGADTNYGNLTAVTILSATNTSLAVSNALTSLTPGQTYHYRVAATNLGGLTRGADMVFTPHTGTITVTTLADSGSGSLRQAIAEALDGETIVYATNGTITLTSGELVITKSLTFSGSGATNLVISGNNSSRVFNIASSNAVVTIAEVTICNGKAANGSDGSNGASGGGISNIGSLTLNGCILSNNAAGTGLPGLPGGPGGPGGNGGGVYNVGTLTLSACTLNANAAGTGGNGGPDVEGGTGGPGGNGGGVYNAGTLTVLSSTLASNSAGTGGNGLDGTGGNAGRGGNGGGVYNAGTLSVISSTLVSNSTGTGGNGGLGSVMYIGNGGSGGSGGGIFSSAAAAASSLRNSLFALNVAAAGGYGGVVGAGGSGPDLSGTFTSLGHNLLGVAENSAGFVNGVNNDLVGTAAAPINPLLGPLTNNRGATPTMALLPGSPAFDAGDDTLTGTDQRGLPRKSSQHVDIGAYELDISAFPAPSVTSATCTVFKVAGGFFSAMFSFSVNPNGLNTTATFEYGVTTSYGASGAMFFGYGSNFVTTNLTVSGLAPGFTGHYRITATSLAGITTGADQTFTTTVTGDLNGDGVVSADEMNTIGQNYWSTTTNRITGLTNLGQGQMAFGLTNTAGLNFTVLASTNLTDWQELTNAAPQLLFNDPAATNAPLRFYRLRWP